MDQRIIFVALGIAALAFASIAFATGGYGMGAAAAWQDGLNNTRMASPGNDSCGGHAPPEGWNATAEGRARENDGERMAPPNRTSVKGRLNMTEMAEANKKFEQAVLSEDYSTAKSLGGEYGFGGPMFPKLNATTFAKYSQIANLESQLKQELGMNATGMLAPMADVQGFERMKGGPMGGQEFENGDRCMRHGFNQGTNQTAQQ
ncbi:MAG: hypothetical protein WCY41_03815 [Candidatus Micrarchaeia archaeon]